MPPLTVALYDHPSGDDKEQVSSCPQQYIKHHHTLQDRALAVGGTHERQGYQPANPLELLRKQIFLPFVLFI